MKRILGVIAWASFLLAGVSCGTTKQLTDVQKQEMLQQIETRDFKIDVNRAYPQAGGTLSLTSAYALTVKGDSVKSYLPYFGRGYSVPYGGGAGLNFEGKVSDYNISQGKKGVTEITMDVVSPDDRLTYIIEVWPNGTVSILVTPQNRQAIRFDGNMDLSPEK